MAQAPVARPLGESDLSHQLGSHPAGAGRYRLEGLERRFVLLELAKVPLAPFVVGLVLAPVAEAELRSGLMASAGSFMPLIERPVACAMLVLSAALFIWPFVRSRRRELQSQATPETRAS